MLPEQCKAARLLIGVTCRRLAGLAELAEMTVNRFETGKKMSAETVSTLQETLEGLGIIFLPAGVNIDGGAGVRLKSEAAEMDLDALVARFEAGESISIDRETALAVAERLKP